MLAMALGMSLTALSAAPVGTTGIGNVAVSAMSGQGGGRMEMDMSGGPGMAGDGIGGTAGTAGEIDGAAASMTAGAGDCGNATVSAGRSGSALGGSSSMTCGGGHWDAGAGGAGSAHGAATSAGSRPDRASDCMGEILAKHMATAVGANPSCGRLMAFLSGGGGGRRRGAQAGGGGSVAGAAALGGASNGTSDGDSVRMGDERTWSNRANQARDESGRAASVGAGRVWGAEVAAVVRGNLGTAGAGCGHGGALSRGRGREASSDGICRRVTMCVTAGAGADPSRSPLP